MSAWNWIKSWRPTLPTDLVDRYVLTSPSGKTAGEWRASSYASTLAMRSEKCWALLAATYDAVLHMWHGPRRAIVRADKDGASLLLVDDTSRAKAGLFLHAELGASLGLTDSDGVYRTLTGDDLKMLDSLRVSKPPSPYESRVVPMAKKDRALRTITITVRDDGDQESCFIAECEGYHGLISRGSSREGALAQVAEDLGVLAWSAATNKRTLDQEYISRFRGKAGEDVEY